MKVFVVLVVLVAAVFAGGYPPPMNYCPNYRNDDGWHRNVTRGTEPHWPPISCADVEIKNTAWCKPRPGETPLENALRGKIVFGFQIDGFYCENHPGPRVYITNIQYSYCAKAVFCGGDLESITLTPEFAYREWGNHQSGLMGIDPNSAVGLSGIGDLYADIPAYIDDCYFNKQPPLDGVTGNPELYLTVDIHGETVWGPLPLGKCVKALDPSIWNNPPILTILDPLEHYAEFHYEFGCGKGHYPNHYKRECAGPKTGRFEVSMPARNDPAEGTMLFYFLAGIVFDSNGRFHYGSYSDEGKYDEGFEKFFCFLEQTDFTLVASGGNGNHQNTLEGDLLDEEAAEELFDTINIPLDIGYPFEIITKPNPCHNELQITGTTANPTFCGEVELTFNDNCPDKSYTVTGTCPHFDEDYHYESCPSLTENFDTQGDFHLNKPGIL